MTKRPIYYDTETTGTRPDKDRIIEIAAYDPVRNLTFAQLVNPEIPIPEEATKIHHISDEMVREAPSFKQVGAAFAEFCSEDAVLIAHNNEGFDKLFLDYEFKRADLTLPDWLYLDTLKWARKYRSDLPRHTLQHLREVYQIPANQAHRALDDVRVLYQVFTAMTDDLPLETILQLMSAPTQLSRMPFGKHQGKLLSEIPKDYVQWLKSTGAFDKQQNFSLKEHFEKLGVL